MSDGNGELPDGWAETTLGDVTVKKVAQVTPNGPINYIDIGAVNNGTKQVEKPNALGKDDEIPSRARQLVAAGDVLVSMTRPNLNAVAKVPADLNGAIASTGFDVLRAIDVEPDWLFNTVKSRHFVESMSAIVQGALYPAVRPGDVRDYAFPLPPLAEQRRIVSKIESLQERSSRARRALSEVGPLLEQFRQSVLRAAFSGRLTADWRAAHRDVEPATELLARIRTERRHRWEQAELVRYEAKGKQPPKNWQDKYKVPQPVDESELPVLPDGWCWASFEEVASIDSNLVSPADYPDHPHIAPDNIEKETGRLLEYRTIAEDGVTSNKNHFFPGQIVYSKIRPYLSKVIVADFEGLCSADMYPISTPLELQYLFRYMLSNFFLDAVQEEAGNRVVLPKVNQKQLYDVAVPIAPMAEQTEIARRINESAASYADIADEVAESESSLTQLDQSILAKAFRGELVPQDPRDEPASELLARIRSTREQVATKPRKKAARRSKAAK